MSGRDTQGFNTPAIQETYASNDFEQVPKQGSNQRSEGQVNYHTIKSLCLTSVNVTELVCQAAMCWSQQLVRIKT